MRAQGVPRIRPTRSVLWRLTALVLVLSLVPLAAVSLVLLRRMEDMTERELTQSYEWLVSEHFNNVLEKLESYEVGMRYTAQNTTILNALISESENPYLMGKVVSTELFKGISMESRQEVKECMIYTASGNALYGSRVTVFTSALEEVWTRQGWNGGEDWFLATSWDDRELLVCVMPIDQVDTTSLTTNRVGYIRLELYLDGLFEPVSGYQVLLTDSDGAVRYASESGIESIELPELEGGQTVYLDSYISMSRSLEDYGLGVVYLFDLSELISEKAALQRTIYPAVVLIALAIALIAYLYFRRFSGRVGALLGKFQRASTGDLSPSSPIGGRDEIALLGAHFDEMLGEMDALNQRTYAQQIEIQEAQYRNLQLQINPHFLYNTLETISAIGATHEVFQICDLCEKLGDIFRYSLGRDGGKYAPVASELKQVEDYIFIQKVRYQFEAYFSIEIEPEQVYMLRFLLQPLVENAILHGLAHKSEPGTLEVYVGRSGENLEIRVSDDGVGMSEEAVEALRARLAAPSDFQEHGSGIGLWNINQRIHLSHGADCGIRVYSKQGQGSAFTLCLPFLTRGQIEDEAI